MHRINGADLGDMIRDVPIPGLQGHIEMLMTVAQIAASGPLVRELQSLLSPVVTVWAEECTHRGIDENTIRMVVSTVTMAMSRTTLADNPAMFKRMAESVMD